MIRSLVSLALSGEVGRQRLPLRESVVGFDFFIMVSYLKGALAPRS